jgi:hypothetical protein
MFLLNYFYWQQVNENRLPDVTEDVTAFTWMEQTLGRGVNETGGGLAFFEDRMTNFATLYYSILLQHWRSDESNGDDASPWWSPHYSSLSGKGPVLHGRLLVSGEQLIIGCICVLILAVTSAISIKNFRIHHDIARDGGVIDTISMMNGSSLPEKIAGELGDAYQTDKRSRAERIYLM